MSKFVDRGSRRRRQGLPGGVDRARHRTARQSHSAPLSPRPQPRCGLPWALFCPGGVWSCRARPGGTPVREVDVLDLPGAVLVWPGALALLPGVEPGEWPGAVALLPGVAPGWCPGADPLLPGAAPGWWPGALPLLPGDEGPLPGWWDFVGALLGAPGRACTRAGPTAGPAAADECRAPLTAGWSAPACPSDRTKGGAPD